VQRRIIVDGIKVEGEDAQRIIDDALGASGDSGQWSAGATIGVITTCALVVGGASCVSGVLAQRFGAGPSWAWMIGVSLVGSPIVAGTWFHVYLRLHRRRLREAMRRRGFELCPRCGYWLKGLGPDSAHCPECGAERRSLADDAASSTP
jgi:hypothetical protein